MRQRLDRGMRAVRRRERVIDIEIAERRELAGEVRIVLFLARVEAQIFQQRDLARPQRSDHPLGLGSDAIGREMHGAAAEARDSGSTSGRSDCDGSGPFGRPKCDITTGLPPRSMIAARVGASRSMRVASVTLPSRTGTFRSARTRTRLPATSRSSRVRKRGIGEAPLRIGQFDLVGVLSLRFAVLQTPRLALPQPRHGQYLGKARLRGDAGGPDRVVFRTQGACRAADKAGAGAASARPDGARPATADRRSVAACRARLAQHRGRTSTLRPRMGAAIRSRGCAAPPTSSPI